MMQIIHIHVPEGATPKDGPSAGVAMLRIVNFGIIKDSSQVGCGHDG